MPRLFQKNEVMEEGDALARRPALQIPAVYEFHAPMTLQQSEGRKEDAKGRKKSSTEKMLPLTPQGTQKKYVFFAKQDPGRARLNS